MNFTREQHETFLLPNLLAWFGLDSNPKYLLDVVEELEILVLKNHREVSVALELFVRVLRENIRREYEILRSEDK